MLNNVYNFILTFWNDSFVNKVISIIVGVAIAYIGMNIFKSSIKIAFYLILILAILALVYFFII